MKNVQESGSFLATVDAVYDDGISLIIDGQAAATTKHYKVNASATFEAGQRVMCRRISGTVVVEYPIDAHGGGEVKRLVSIAITTHPTKTTYRSGETFDATGMVVTATFDDDSTRAVTGYTVAPMVLTDGVSSVTVSYTAGGVTATATQVVNVTAVLDSISVTTPPTKTDYDRGEAFDPTGMVVTAEYSDGSSRAVTGYTYAPQMLETAGSQGVTISYTESGATMQTVIYVTVAVPRVAVPQQSGTLTYSGEAQSPQWTGYDSTIMTISGTTVATGAGTYTATFTLAEGYAWSDGRSTPKSVQWSIGKAAGSVVLSPSSLNLDAEHLTGTITVTRAGTGAISAAASSQSISIVLSGGTINVTALGNGTATVTVSVAEDANHFASSAAATVTVTMVQCWGVVWDYANSSPALTRLTPENDPNGLVSAAVSTEPVAAENGTGGSSPFDAFSPWSEMEEYNIVGTTVGAKKGESGFSRATADVMVKIPQFWYAVIDDATNSKRYYYIANGAVTGMDVHPGSGCFVARYMAYGLAAEGSGVSVIPASVTGTDLTQLQSSDKWINRRLQRDCAKAKGDGWQLLDIAAWSAVQLLYLVEFASFDSQNCIGVGIKDFNAETVTGTADVIAHHTGSAGGRSSVTAAIQYRGIENPWGSFGSLLDGLNQYMTGDLYFSTDPSAYVEWTTKVPTGYAKTGGKLLSTNGGYRFVKNLRYFAPAPWLIGLAQDGSGGGSATTYVTDPYYANIESYSSWTYPYTIATNSSVQDIRAETEMGMFHSDARNPNNTSSYKWLRIRLQFREEAT